MVKKTTMETMVEKQEIVDGGNMTGETMAEAHGTELNKAANELTHGKSPSKQGGRGKGV